MMFFLCVRIKINPEMGFSIFSGFLNIYESHLVGNNIRKGTLFFTHLICLSKAI